MKAIIGHQQIELGEKLLELVEPYDAEDVVDALNGGFAVIHSETPFLSDDVDERKPHYICMKYPADHELHGKPDPTKKMAFIRAVSSVNSGLVWKLIEEEGVPCATPEQDAGVSPS